MNIAESLVEINKESQVPVYLQIANSIITQIRRGALKPESALPGSRALADALRVHRKTVVAAYDELYAQSWVDVYPRKGIYVAKNLPDISPRPLALDMPINSISNTTQYKQNECFVPGLKMYKAPTENNIVINDGFPDTRLAPVE